MPANHAIFSLLRGPADKVSRVCVAKSGRVPSDDKEEPGELFTGSFVAYGEREE
jgi:hypothetical protein